MNTRLLSMVTLAGSLLFAASNVALAMEASEARQQLQTSTQSLKQGERDSAQRTLDRLVKGGMPVEHALAVVKSAVAHDFKSKEMDRLAKSMEQIPAAAAQRGDARSDMSAGEAVARIAVQAIERNHDAKEVDVAIDSAKSALRDGVEPKACVELVGGAIEQGKRGHELAEFSQDRVHELALDTREMSSPHGEMAGHNQDYSAAKHDGFSGDGAGMGAGSGSLTEGAGAGQGTGGR